MLRGGYLLDQRGELQIDDLDEGADWRVVGAEDGLVETNSYLWTRLVLHNDMADTYPALLSLSREADSIWVYAEQDNVLTYRGLRTLNSSDATQVGVFPAAYSVELRARDSVLVYARMYFRDGWPLAAATRAVQTDARAAVNREVGHTAWQFFYTGIMVSISLLSVFVYLLFKDRSLLLFAWVTMSFGLYFISFNSMTAILGLPPARLAGITTLQVSIVSLVLALSFFIARFLRLASAYPRYSRYYWGVTVLAVLTQVVPYQLGWRMVTVFLVANVVLLIWVVTVALPILTLSRRKNPAAHQLLLSAIMLAPPGVVYLLDLIWYNSLGGQLQYGLQIGSLSSTAILIRALTRQIQDMKTTTKRLSEQTELKSRFFANISHEFRTPLTLIMGPLEQLLSRHPQTESSNDEHALLSLAYTNANRQLELVNRILQLSRLEANATELDTSVVDLVQLVHSAGASFTHLAVQRGISIVYAQCPHALPCTLDARKMEDVLHNLLSNALKFTPRGGTVTIGVGEGEHGVVVEVSDTGAGIPASQLAGIFDRFIQAEGSTYTEQEGSGLGLSLVRELVRLHKGNVAVRSSLGQGTTFTVQIPQDAIASEAVSTDGEQTVSSVEQASYTAVPDGAQTVLIVDDNAAIRLLVSAALHADYRIIEAADGQKALQIARDQQPSLIISDVMMPFMDGYSLTEAVKTDLEISHIPVILLTARAASEDRIAGLSIGGDDYITKPFKHNELRARVHNLIESRKLLRQRYATSIELKPTEVAAAPVDAEFLQRCLDVVEGELMNERFRVGDLARAVSMSPASLNRKLRSLLEVSTNQFIQSVRLQRAQDLLNTQVYTVAEVGTATGFSSTSYFVKAYREKFGITPGSALRV